MNRFLATLFAPVAALQRARKLSWVDGLIILALFGAFWGVVRTAGEWTGVMRPMVEIDLSASALPWYTLLSLTRGLVAYLFSLGFTLVYGYWAAKDPVAERVLIPLLDILQSVPVLTFMPGVTLALVALFPRSNLGLEASAVLLIFTGQAWNMTFSFYHSLRNIPADQKEAATLYRFNWWQRLKWLELPFSTVGLVWNSMMSMAGGWFFLMLIEVQKFGNKDFRLPGLGSYMKAAVDAGDKGAMLWAIIAMVAMIVFLDQLLWRPVVVWAQKFRVEEGGEAEEMSSWFLTWLRRSGLLPWVRDLLREAAHKSRERAQKLVPKTASRTRSKVRSFVSPVLFAALLVTLAGFSVKMVLLLKTVHASQWASIFGGAGLTLVRVLVSTALGTLWTVPAGLAIGLSPKLSRLLQPVVQVGASFPAPMLFPVVIVLLKKAGVGLGIGSIVLMLLGTQWYILFNIVAGATAIPSDLREMSKSYRIQGKNLFWNLHLPAIFPYLVTGWVTAAGGAWNASIASEAVPLPGGGQWTTMGLGALITQATDDENFGLLAAGVLVLSALVVGFNRLVWARCHQLAEARYSLSK